MDTALAPSKSFEQDKELYSKLRQISVGLYQSKEYEKALDYAFVAGQLAWQNNCIWKDHKIEQILSGIADEITWEDETTSVESPKKNDECILYLASFVADSGGHSEVLKNWIKATKDDFDVKLFLTNVHKHNPVDESTDIMSELDGIVDDLCVGQYDLTYSQRIRQLFGYINRYEPDRIILFINPNDVVAYSALTARSDRPTTIFYNHADHTFWIGSDLIDYLVEFRKTGGYVSNAKRGIAPSAIIPLTSQITPESVGPSPELLDIDPGSTISLSVGNFNKVTIDLGPDYFRSIMEILESHPNHHHIFITNPPEREEMLKYFADDEKISQRFHIIGPFADLENMYSNADFLVETFPMRGGMVRLESMREGLPLICYKDKSIPFFSEMDYLPSRYSFEFSNQKELIQIANHFITENTDLDRIGNELHTHFRDKYRFSKVKQEIKKLVDCPKTYATVENIQSDTTLNDREYSEHMRTDFNPNLELLFQSLLKDSEYTLPDRAKFYSNCLCNSEIQGTYEVLGLGFSSVFGRPGYSLGRNIDRRIRDII